VQKQDKEKQGAGGNIGTETGLDDQDTIMKRGGTTGEYTQEDQIADLEQEDNGGNGDDDQMGLRSQSLSHQKSVKSNKGYKRGGGDEENDDDNDNTYQKYLYRAVASDRFATFHANMNELYFELI
jgi:hypothetical protein